MNIVKKKFGQNCSKIYSKTHQIAPFLKIFSGEHAPDPPTKCIPPLSKINLTPPPKMKS